MSYEDPSSLSTSQLNALVSGDSSFEQPLEPSEKFFILPSNYYRITESAKHLFYWLGKAEMMFMRGDAVMELVPSEGGCLILRQVKAEEFTSRIEGLGRLFKHIRYNGKTVLSPAICCVDKAKRLLATAEARKYLPPVSVVITSPIIVEGEGGQPRVLARGYHKVGGGIVVTQGVEPLDVPLPEAINALLELLSGFHFETPSDTKRALAMMLTPALLWGGFFKNACIPMFLVAADDSQAGKGYLLHLEAAIYGEKLTPMAPRQGGVGSFDEDVNAALLKGNPFLMLDNLRKKLDSPHLESFITARDSFSVRTPHRGAIDIDIGNYVLMATSNGFETTTDLENRLLRLRILKRPSSYRFKRFNGEDVVTHVKSHQSYYLGCVFSVVRYWIENGKQRTNERRHSFRDWAQTLDWILQNAFKDKVGGRLMDGSERAPSEGLAAALGLSDQLDSLPEEAD